MKLRFGVKDLHMFSPQHPAQKMWKKVRKMSLFNKDLYEIDPRCAQLANISFVMHTT